MESEYSNRYKLDSKQNETAKHFRGRQSTWAHNIFIAIPKRHRDLLLLYTSKNSSISTDLGDIIAGFTFQGPFLAKCFHFLIFDVVWIANSEVRINGRIFSHSLKPIESVIQYAFIKYRFIWAHCSWNNIFSYPT